jgi:hypothetical protein
MEPNLDLGMMRVIFNRKESAVLLSQTFGQP